jgi:hypothetical protein
LDYSQWNQLHVYVVGLGTFVLIVTDEYNLEGNNILLVHLNASYKCIAYKI